MNDTGVAATGGLRFLGRAYLRRRYAILFYTLLLTMVAAPVLAAFEFKGSLIEFFLAVNLLAGIFFGLFYWILEQSWPGTFTFVGEFSRMSAFYFSFVTLATLGYGDIVPRTDVARGLAIVEGVGGQLFLAVMVARLVSLYGRRHEEHEV